jgi:enolase
MNLMFPLFSLTTLEYPLVSIEQPFDKDDWEHSKKFTTLELCQVHSVLLYFCSVLFVRTQELMHNTCAGSRR